MSGYEYNALPGVKQALLNDIFTIIYSSGIDIAGVGGNFLPTIERGIVLFNGSRIQGEAGDDFRLTGSSVSYVETYAAPYDVVVGAVLLRAAFYYPDVLMNYENINDSKWDNALTLYESLFGEWVPFAGDYLLTSEDTVSYELWEIANDESSAQFYYEDADFLSDFESFTQSADNLVKPFVSVEQAKQSVVVDINEYRARKKQ
jgi:hypothetical protein